MNTPILRLDSLLLFFAILILIIFRLDSMWSGSVDLAHHYALAFRISEQWALLSSNDPSLGGMNIYPNLAHTSAAILGFLVNSTFLGLQLITLLSLALLWAAVLICINSLPFRIAFTSSIGLCVLMILNAKYAILNIHGSEIIGNFFFAQLFGQAVLFVAMAISIYLERYQHKIAALLFFLLSILINVKAHLLPTVEMLGTLCGLVLVNLFVEENFISGILNKLLVSFAILLAAVLGIIFNPSFIAMRMISENNGSLGLLNLSYPSGIIGLCLASLILSIYLLYYWKKNKYATSHAAIKYLAFYGITIAILCLVQFALLKFDLGSDYAVKKYGFSIASYLFIGIAVSLGIFIANFLNTKYWRVVEQSEYARFFAILLSFCLIFLSSTSSKKKLDVSDVVSMERKLINVIDVFLPTPIPNKSDVIIGLNKMPPAINYMFSIALAKSKRNEVIRNVLSGKELRNFANIRYILGGRDYLIRYNPHCRKYTNGSILIIDAKCASNPDTAAIQGEYE